MPNEWKRKLLNSVVDSQLLYAAPVCISRESAVARAKTNLIRPQRVSALRTIRAYRTVSDEASLVLASTVPADLLDPEQSSATTETPSVTTCIPSWRTDRAQPTSRTSSAGRHSTTFQLTQTKGQLY
ncbi:uncharacterized protein LOC107884821 isoform X1 [Acyrthosiphon pisum]|uniref:Uncharacterized protein n=1 Tax=Acyrthosiphon pisum TaxID=7029 RepID=A0A8R2NWQ5_ACYPI|nr:uncharacterized protein LOC107884821 isoform X1 [Acyrthosiphon pisum]